MSDLSLVAIYYQEKEEKSDRWTECELIPHSLYYTKDDAMEAKENLTEDLNDSTLMRYIVKKVTYDELVKELGKEVLIEWGDSGQDVWVIDGDNEDISIEDMLEDEIEELEEMEEDY